MLTAIALAAALAHDAPQPVLRWVFDESRIRFGTLMSVNGPNAEVSGFPKPVQSPWGPAAEIRSEWHAFTFPWDYRREWPDEPKQNFSATFAFRTEESLPNRRLGGCKFFSDGKMVGWQVLIDDGKPVFTVANAQGEARVEGPNAVTGAWHWLTVAYTNNEAWMVLDGKMIGRQKAEFGPLEYPGRAPLAVSGYWHGRGSYEFTGVVREMRLDAPALSPEQAAQYHGNPDTVPPLAPEKPSDAPLAFVIQPYMQNPATNAMTVAFEFNKAVPATIRHGTRPDNLDRSATSKAAKLHHVRLSGLSLNTPYFFRVEAESAPAEATRVQSELGSFKTLPAPNQTVRFAITADTQDIPANNRRVGEAMWEHRPDFVVIVGDLVGNAWYHHHWVDHFFGSMRPLLSHVPLVPALGNHERNARLYYYYMEVPEPEYRYALRSGPVEFFVTDTEQNTSEGSEQFSWLSKALAGSNAPWKIALHHYPAYSSEYIDFDSPRDHGGDSQAKNLVPLYDKHEVDLVFSGHVHHYERTFPMRRGLAWADGTTYFTVGGGGGGLDRSTSPTRMDFSRIRRTVHHFALVTATPSDLQVQVFDWENNLIDGMHLRKRGGMPSRLAAQAGTTRR